MAQRLSHPTVIILHGLEGSSDAAYVLGTASKAFAAGFNVLRYNVRGCGGTAHLSLSLYHSGLTADLHSLVRELIERDRLPALYFIRTKTVRGRKTAPSSFAACSNWDSNRPGR